MIPDPIPEHRRNLDKPTPKCELRPDEFRIYATRARWDARTIDLLLKCDPPHSPFMCGGREVRLVL